MNSYLRYVVTVAAVMMLTVDDGGAASAQNPRIVHSFCAESHCPDGYQPAGGLTRGPDGAFYGVTYAGGNSNSGNPPGGAGVAYRVTRRGKFSVLHELDFSTEGAESVSNLTLGSDGNLYGTTPTAGTHGLGTIFRISSTGDFTVLHQFGEATNDGGAPNSPPIEDAEGNWYGTANTGGLNGGGIIYKISREGTFQVLHNFDGFSGGTGGAGPQAALLLASDGNFYGTTTDGGSDNYGTIFRMTPSGTVTTLHVFTFVDGAHPQHALVTGPDGALFGTTSYGGSGPIFAGTVFRIALNGKFTSIHSFDGAGGGSGPTSSLTLMPDGYLYGVYGQDGRGHDGTIYRISPSGNYAKLYDFVRARRDGRIPEATMVRGFDNALYGTTAFGGMHDDAGTVFRFVPPATQ